MLTEAKGTKFECVSKLGSAEDFMSDEGRGIASIAKSKGFALGMGRGRRGLVGPLQRPEADRSFSRLPGRDLVRVEPLVGQNAVQGGRVGASLSRVGNPNVSLKRLLEPTGIQI